jgi:hypothetical protein
MAKTTDKDKHKHKHEHKHNYKHKQKDKDNRLTNYLPRWAHIVWCCWECNMSYNGEKTFSKINYHSKV